MGLKSWPGMFPTVACFSSQAGSVSLLPGSAGTTHMALSQLHPPHPHPGPAFVLTLCSYYEDENPLQRAPSVHPTHRSLSGPRISPGRQGHALSPPRVDGKVQAQRGSGTCPGSHSERLAGHRGHPLNHSDRNCSCLLAKAEREGFGSTGLGLVRVWWWGLQSRGPGGPSLEA